MLERYVRAWEGADLDGFVALLREDAILSMPPWRQWYHGREAIRAFFAWAWDWKLPGYVPFRLVPIAANRPPAFALYRGSRENPEYRAHGIELLTLQDDAIERLTTEAVLRRPSGTAASAGACYAQVVLCEDLSVNGVLGARTPLALSTWFGRTGISEIPWLADPSGWRAWAQRIRLDFDELRPYARAVYASTDAYLADLRDDALDQSPGKMPACVLNALLLRLSTRRGEIAGLHDLDCHSPMAY
ncbi:MAG TPA: nuclear transport factor 2 family protein [Chthoniobacterales bacterium]|nr:nuclear transport factor 2 family protein [Chthoniobacterales bacterium]